MVGSASVGWTCPECHYSPDLYTVRENVPPLLNTHDARAQCKMYKEQAARGEPLKCPHLDSVRGRTVALR